ncbi:MAG: hypothetical protein QM783_16045 [Phycisphaerales bacterium]
MGNGYRRTVINQWSSLVGVTLIVAAGAAPGCQGLHAPGASDEKPESSANAFTYHPINPLTVWVNAGDLDGLPATGYRDAFLSDFANDATRVGMYKINANGSFNAGVVGANADGENYSMVIDFIKYLTLSIPVRVFEATTPARPPTIDGVTVSWSEAERHPKRVDRGSGIPAKIRYLAIEATASAEDDLKQLKSGSLTKNNKVVAKLSDEESNFVREVFAGSMPVYVGVGVRVRADFKSFKGDIKISGLPGLSAEASAGNIRGTLSVQTMGVGGKEITPLMRIPSDLSIASIQTAIETATSVKLKIYEENTVIQPMVVGFESPVTDRDVVAELTSFIYSYEVKVGLKRNDLIKPDEAKLIWILWPASGGEQAAPVNAVKGAGGSSGTQSPSGTGQTPANSGASGTAPSTTTPGAQVRPEEPPKSPASVPPPKQ